MSTLILNPIAIMFEKRAFIYDPPLLGLCFKMGPFMSNMIVKLDSVLVL